MRIGLTLAILWILPAFTGCKEGGCYYTCCVAENDCVSSCMSGIKDAEQCAIKAQEDCLDGDEGYLTRVEWSEVDGAFCKDCSSPVCAPGWWEANQQKELSPSADTETATSP